MGAGRLGGATSGRPSPISLSQGYLRVTQAACIQHSSDSHVPSQLAVSAEMSSGESATAGVMTTLEAVSVQVGRATLKPNHESCCALPLGYDPCLCSKEPGCRADCCYPFSDD